MNVLEKIKKIRSEKRISQSDIAEYLGIAHNNYGRIERGEGELSVGRLFKIAEFLQVSPNELLGSESPTFGEENENEGKPNFDEINDLTNQIRALEGRLTEKERIFSFQEYYNKGFVRNIKILASEYAQHKAREYNCVTYISLSKDEKNSYFSFIGESGDAKRIFAEKDMEYKTIITSSNLKDALKKAFKKDYLAAIIYQLISLIDNESSEFQYWNDAQDDFRRNLDF